MTTLRIFTQTFATLLSLTALNGVAHAVNSPAHVAQATVYVSQIKPENNRYSSPAVLAYQPANTLIATTKCSSFTALLLKNSYPGLVTNEVLTALTGSSSPYADEWYTAILEEHSDPVSGLGFHQRQTVAAVQPGDILASAYTTSGNTGHTMTVAEIADIQYNLAPPQPIPNVSTVNKYIVKIFDSSKSGHGSANSQTAWPDSRYKKQWDSVNSAWTWDDGIGFGYIAIYEDSATGQPVAWAWSAGNTQSFYYAVTPPVGSPFDYRPLVAGYLSGI